MLQDSAPGTAVPDARRRDTPIRVAHISTVDFSLRYLLLDLLLHLKTAGYQVVGISAPGPDVPVLEAAGIRHIPVPMSRRALTPLSDLLSLWHLYRVLRREQFTIVHTHTPKAGLLGRLAARLARVPVIVHTHHGFPFTDRAPWLRRKLFMTLEAVGASCSDLILSVNQEDIAIAVREGICSQKKIVVLSKGGIGVDLARFDRDRLTADGMARKRAEFGLPQGAPVVGFVGRLVRDKGLLELLQAARLVRERVPEVRFLIVGPSDRAKPDALTADTAASYGVSDICIFTGQREDVPELYPLMDVFVLPSHREGFPLVLGEAAASRVPVIATDVRGCREAVEDGSNGMLVPLGNVHALADAICGLLTDREKARRMGEEGRRVALERFDQRLVFERVRAEYQRLLLKKGL